MSYRVTWETSAVADVNKMGPDIVRRVITRVNWPGKNFERIKPQPLTGALKGYYKLRIGPYRVIYSVNH